mgnify:CR=1 FL=1
MVTSNILVVPGAPADASGRDERGDGEGPGPHTDCTESSFVKSVCICVVYNLMTSCLSTVGLVAVPFT